MLQSCLGHQNTATGSIALATNTTGSLNTASGYQSLRLNTTGSNSTANGYLSLGANTTGNDNAAFGTGSLLNNSTGSNNVGLGNYAGAYETGSSALYVDAFNRANTAGDKAGAILYGQMNTTPASQTLTINAATTVANTALFKNLTDSTTAFQIQNGSGTALFTVDSANTKVTVVELEVTGNLTVNGHFITGEIGRAHV